MADQLQHARRPAGAEVSRPAALGPCVEVVDEAHQRDRGDRERAGGSDAGDRHEPADDRERGCPGG